MNSLWALVKKDLRLIWRSKSYMLALLVVPILLAVILSGAFYNSEPYSITLGVYSTDYDDDKISIVETLAKDFAVLRWHSNQSCIDAMKQNVVNACIILPEEFDFYGDETNQIVFYVDESRVNLVWMILNTLNNGLRDYSSDVSFGFAQNFLIVFTGFQDNYEVLQKNLRIADEQVNSTLEYSKGLETKLGVESAHNVQKTLSEAVREQESVQRELNNVYAELSARIEEGRSWIDTLEDHMDALSISNSSKQELNSDIEELGRVWSSSEDRLEELDLALTGLNSLGKKQKDAEKQSIEVMSGLQEANVLQKTVLSGIDDIEGALMIMNKTITESERLFSLIQVQNASKVAMPFMTDIRSISTRGSYFSYLFPTLVMILSAFGAVFLSSSMVVLEKKSRARLRNYFTPAGFSTFFFAHVSSVLLVVVPAVFAFVGVSAFFGVGVHFSVFLILFLVVCLFLLMGMCLGHISKSEQGNAMLSVVVVSILVFFSNTIIPIESVSGVVEKIIRFNPLVMGELALRKVLLYETPWSVLLTDVSFLLLLVLVFGIAAFSISVITLRRIE